MKGLLLLLSCLFAFGCQVKKGSTDNIFEAHVPLPNTFVAASSLNTTYDVGQTISFTMTFPYPVTVTGAPELNLTIGSSAKAAAFVSGSGTTVLTFRYTVVAGDNDLDGINLNSINLNGGSLVFNGTENCSLSFNLPNFTSILVDTLAPTITSITPPNNGIYLVDQNMSFTVNFSERVSVTGSPRLALNIGGVTKYATYLSGSGSSALLLRYTVADTDSDTDGIAINSPLQLNSGTIKDASSHAAALAFSSPATSSVIVAGINPIIRSITPPSSGTYLIGTQLNFSVTYNKTVVVTGSPQLKLNIGGMTKFATYVSGSASSILQFRYTIIGGDLDADGIVLSSPVDLNGGSINDSSSNPSITAFQAPSTTGVLVFTTTPALVRVDLPSSPPVNGYAETASFNLTAVFAEPMTVTGTTSRIKFDVNGVAKYATYLSGSGTTSLLYRYTVTTSDQDLDGITLQSPLELNGSTIVNGNGSAPILTFTPPTAIVKVDGVAPTITSNTNPIDKIYTTSQTLDFIVNFSEPVVITGTPRLNLQVGSSIVNANYLSGTGTSAITFRYTVSNVDFDDNGITLFNAIELNGGTIRDPVNHNSALTLVSLDTSGILVDATSAHIETITAPSNKAYKTSETLNFVVHWSKPVTITAVPRITITLGSGTVFATYVTGSGSQDTIFRYTVVANDFDYDGITLTTPMTLNGGTIRDTSNVNALLAFTAPATTGVQIDGINLAPTALTPPSDATYKINDVMEFTVTFNYGAYVTGSPRLTLAVGSTNRYATYVSGSGTTGLLFRYTVAEGDLDADGVALTNSIDLNGGSIKDFFTDNATALSFTVSAYPNKLVDGVRPTISTVTASANKTYKINEPISFTLTYSEIVTVSGTPRIALVIGSSTRYATYVSGSNSNQLLFQYVPQNGDTDLDGISASATVDPNGGSISDRATNEQTVFTYTVPTLTGVRVDATAPTIISVAAVNSGTFRVGQSFSFDVTYSEVVTVTGTPALSLAVGGATRSATYVSGSSSSVLRYTYTVIAGDEDINGVETLSLSGTARDGVGNDTDYSSFTPGAYAGIIVDGIVPTISSVTLPSDGTYKNATAAQVLTFSVIFSEDIVLTGTPQLLLTIGLSARTAAYTSMTGAKTLNFSYTVTASDLDLDGIALANSNLLSLNGGTIKDAAGNSAVLNMGSRPMSSVIVLSTAVVHWYNLTNTASLTINGSNRVTAIADRAGSLNLSYPAGADYSITGFNSSSRPYMTCDANVKFTNASNATIRTMIAAYKAPTSAAGKLFFINDGSTFDFNNPQVEFSGSTSANSGVNAAAYVNSAFSGYGTTLTSFWSSGVTQGSYVKYESNAVGKIELCSMVGQLAETIFMNNDTSAAEIEVIKAYFASKYGF